MDHQQLKQPPKPPPTPLHYAYVNTGLCRSICRAHDCRYIQQHNITCHSRQMCFHVLCIYFLAVQRAREGNAYAPISRGTCTFSRARLYARELFCRHHTRNADNCACVIFMLACVSRFTYDSRAAIVEPQTDARRLNVCILRERCAYETHLRND